MNNLKESELNTKLLTRKPYLDNRFIGYEGELYVYVLDVLTSSISGNITNKFWVLKKNDDNTYLKVPTKRGDFIHRTFQEDGSFFKDINGEPIPIRDSEGNVLTESIEVTDNEGNTTTKSVPLFRKTEFSRNISNFAGSIIPAVNVTIDRYFGQEI